MFKVFRAWLDHFFADEQALLLVVLLAVGLAAILMFGSTLAPVFASMILAYLTLGLVEWLERFGVNHLPAVWGIYSLLHTFVGCNFLHYHGGFRKICHRTRPKCDVGLRVYFVCCRCCLGN